ncbi:hypothetical protein N9W57_07980 [Pseudomonadales bacterium]|nr:hypothetical protein [Pseudomonadales bacterium]MDG1938911.1 hypothetical protein [Pseudomonadales bacterium]
MSEFSDGMNVWILYASTAVAILAIMWRFLRNYISLIPLLLLMSTLFIILATPVAVPETQSMAPAWLVSLFEFALGRPETAEKAVLPLIALLTVSYAVILIISILRRR